MSMAFRAIVPSFLWTSERSNAGWGNHAPKKETSSMPPVWNLCLPAGIDSILSVALAIAFLFAPMEVSMAYKCNISSWKRETIVMLIFGLCSA